MNEVLARRHLSFTWNIFFFIFFEIYEIAQFEKNKSFVVMQAVFIFLEFHVVTALFLTLCFPSVSFSLSLNS